MRGSLKIVAEKPLFSLMVIYKLLLNYFKEYKRLWENTNLRIPFYVAWK